MGIEVPDGEDVAACLRVLRALAARPELCSGGDAALAEVRGLAARLLRATREDDRRESRRRDRDLLDAAGIRGVPRAACLPVSGELPRAVKLPVAPNLSPAPEAPPLSAPRSCYVCRAPYQRLHPFYDALCPACGDLNFARRQQTADLTGWTALVTGGRVRIGFQTALKLLRAGASVLVTTRFPRDAARRYAAEADFASWADRLRLFALDLRHLPAVLAFAETLTADLDRLDVLVNNAAQTVRRPPAFYRHLIEGERQALPGPLQGLVAEVRPGSLVASAAGLDLAALPPALLSQVPILPGDADDDPALFPPGERDADGQQLDRRDRNTWSLRLEEVQPAELLEVHAVNCLAPFLLLQRLGPLLCRPAAWGRHVVNVAAAEGQFQGPFKTGRHPHTNMAKAALNMLTLTLSEPFAARGVFVNAVDTGWVSHQAPLAAAARLEESGFRLPLDAVDGAARVLDPLFTGLNTGRHEQGKLWKDYRVVPW
jgi:NAD(P)-dependent dehydrogenase (short-subunit alcohol dehydrogenase family)